MNLPFWITDHTTHAIPQVRIVSWEPLHISEHFITCGSVQRKIDHALSRHSLSSDPLGGLRQMLRRDSLLWSGNAPSDVVPAEDSSIRFAPDQSLLHTKE